VRTTWIGALFGTAMLAGCFDSATQQAATKDLVVKLSKEEEQLLDAMAFLFSGNGGQHKGWEIHALAARSQGPDH
jgi:hypothetical protein